MKDNAQNSQRQQMNSISNSRALFLTQDGSYSPKKKMAQQIKKQEPQQDKGQLWQMNKLCDSLLQQVSELKTQQILSQYRQLNRNFSQNSIEKEGELNKLQKISKIDIGYLRKKMQNEPQIDLNYFKQRIDSYQEQVFQKNELVQQYKQRVDRIQKQFW